MACNDLQHCEITNIQYVFKCFLKSAQNACWVAPKDPELLSFMKCYQNQWKALKTVNYWPSKWRTYQYSIGFTTFSKFARSKISSPSNLSKITNFYRPQQCNKKTNEMLQILTNMKPTNDEFLNILFVLYVFLQAT